MFPCSKGHLVRAYLDTKARHYLKDLRKFFRISGDTMILVIAMMAVASITNGKSTLLSIHLEASEDIIAKFKSQSLHIIRIRHCNAGGSGNSPSLIPALWNIVHK